MDRSSPVYGRRSGRIAAACRSRAISFHGAGPSRITTSHVSTFLGGAASRGDATMRSTLQLIAVSIVVLFVVVGVAVTRSSADEPPVKDRAEAKTAHLSSTLAWPEPQVLFDASES